MAVWTLDGVALPRNPDSYDVKFDNANVSYEPQAGGNLIRIQAPQSIGGATLTLTWKNADRRMLNNILRAHNPLGYGVIHKLLIAGIQPSQIAQVFFDTPQKTMSQDVVIIKPGEGGTRNDLTLMLRMSDPWMRSANLIPQATPTAAQVLAMFGGLMGNGLDGIPVWNGVGWNTSLSGSGSATVALSNLGTAPWAPIIRINGPFNSLTLSQAYFDVDGTGSGTQFVWTGPHVVSGQWVLFDTSTKRCYLVIGGLITEVYSFAVSTVSASLPFAYWPPMNPGNNTVTVTTTAFGANTSLDYTNAGTNQFWYW